MAIAQTNKDVVQRGFDSLNDRDRDAFADLHADDAVLYAFGEQFRGIDSPPQPIRSGQAASGARRARPTRRRTLAHPSRAIRPNTSFRSGWDGARATLTVADE